MNNTSANEGGSIYLFLPGDLSINNCVFQQNAAIYGSSIYYEEHDQKILKMSSNNFIENVATGNGAALYIYDSSGNILVENCKFLTNSIMSNSENLGSVLFLNNPGNISIINSSFENNVGILGTCIYYSESRKILFLIFFNFFHNRRCI